MSDSSTSLHFHNLDIEDAFTQLRTNKDGLREDEAKARREEFGWNEIPDAAQRKWWTLLIKQFKSLLVWVLVAAMAISLTFGHAVDAWIIGVVILINAAIGFVQEVRAERAVHALKSLMAHRAKVLRNGEKQNIDARELVPGDVIILEEGDAIPADARLFEASNLRAIESSLTGESVPVEKNTATLPEDTALADQKNMVRKSTYIAGGYALALVTGTGMQTAIGEIAQTLGTIKPPLSNFQRKTNMLARQMALISVVSALALFLVNYFFQDMAVDEILVIAIAALVSSIPEGLPAVLAIVLAIGANRMSRRNAIVRDFNATETLGAVTTIITDKTGTLTQNTLTVRRLFLPGEDDIEVTGEGWRPTGHFMWADHVIEPEEHPQLQRLLEVSAFCNNSDIQHLPDKDAYHLVGDPTEGALLVLARKAGIFPQKDNETRRIDDLPFNSEIKMRATVVERESKRRLLVVGAPEQVLNHCKQWSAKEGDTLLSNENKEVVRQKIENWSSDAMRVIALAYREVGNDFNTIDPEQIGELTLAGVVGMIDPPRPEVKEAVAQCKRAGIRVIMATGDHINTAIAIGHATGILVEGKPAAEKALTEKQLLAMDEDEFEHAVMEADVLARLTPNMKLRIATLLQDKGELIAMTGDGVNDAPALKKADVGVAMGIMGTDVARDAATIVLADDKFSTIVKAIEEGRIVFVNARQTSFFLLTTNFAEIVALLVTTGLGMPIPLTATQILWLNLVTDGLGDKALATERGHGDVLEDKPVNIHENILNKKILPFLVINVVLMTTLTILAFKWFLPVSVEKARSAAFIILGCSQLFNVLNMRSLKQSVFAIGIFSNKWVNVALFISFAIQVMIIEVPFFEVLFRFDPVSLVEFTVLTLLASSVLWFGELYKWVKPRIVKVKNHL